VTPKPFSLEGRVAVVTGGYGVIGGSLSAGLGEAGARIALLGRRRNAAEEAAAKLCAGGVDAIAVVADVSDADQLRAVRDEVISRWQRVDILVNAAGGNVPRARSDASSIFDVPLDAIEEVMRLNLHGSLIPSLVFGEAMAAQGSGSIVNISSMASLSAVSGVMGYSVAKAGLDNFTRWLAVDLARRHGDGIRVNAIAPGFFVTTQNRSVLLDANGEYTARSRTIIQRTPMGRFGRPEELVGAVQWLCSDAASFVTGTVIPIDGGFSAFSGV